MSQSTLTDLIKIAALATESAVAASPHPISTPDGNRLITEVIGTYIDAAKHHQGLTSDLQLSRIIGTHVSQWRTSRSLPSDERMIRLAELGRQNVAGALIDLSMMRAAARHEPIAAMAWMEIGNIVRNALKAAVAAIAFIFYMSGANAGTGAELCTIENAKVNIMRQSDYDGIGRASPYRFVATPPPGGFGER